MWLSQDYCIKAWLWLIFLMCIIILIVFAMCQFTSPNIERYVSENKTSVEYSTLDNVIDEIENGDIVFLSGDTLGEKTCRWFTGCIFSHVGFLFREVHPVTQEDIVYVFECDLGQNTKDGVRIMPLRDKLNRYNGFKIGALKKLVAAGNNERPVYDDIMKIVGKYMPVEFDNKIITWWVTNQPRYIILSKILKQCFVQN